MRTYSYLGQGPRDARGDNWSDSRHILKVDKMGSEVYVIGRNQRFQVF